MPQTDFCEPPADLEREAIEAARRRSPADKFRDGLRLFDRTCRIMADGIRSEKGASDSIDVLQAIRARLLLARQLERR